MYKIYRTLKYFNDQKRKFGKLFNSYLVKMGEERKFEYRLKQKNTDCFLQHVNWLSAQ